MSKAPKKRRPGPPKGTGGRPPIEGERMMQFAFRLRRGLIEDIDAIAADLGMGRNELVRAMLDEGVAKRKRRPRAA